MKKLLKIIVKIMFVVFWIIYNSIIWCYNTTFGRILFSIPFLLGPILVAKDNKAPTELEFCLYAIIMSVGLILFMLAGSAPDEYNPHIDYHGDRVYPLRYSRSPKHLRESVAKIKKRVKETLLKRIKGMLNTLKN